MGFLSNLYFIEFEGVTLKGKCNVEKGIVDSWEEVSKRLSEQVGEEIKIVNVKKLD